MLFFSVQYEKHCFPFFCVVTSFTHTCKSVQFWFLATLTHFSKDPTRAGVLVLETFGTRKILLLVRLCTRYSFEKVIEHTSTLSNGKASCRLALKCQSNFVLPRVMSKYVTTSVCSSFIVQVQGSNFFAVEPVPIVIGLT